jgi:hypothetical protein
VFLGSWHDGDRHKLRRQSNHRQWHRIGTRYRQLLCNDVLDAIIDVNGSGVDVRLGMPCWFDSWGLDLATPPAIRVAATNTLRYPSNSRFTNANGGANTGGAGTITAY